MTAWALAPQRSAVVIIGVVGCGAFPPVDGFSVGGHSVEEGGDELGVGEGKRKPDYDRLERRIGITREVWYLARTLAGGSVRRLHGYRRLRQGPVTVLRITR